ncbi:MAG: DUF5318 domain-containing protein, partial [Corynebacterium sp.]|nr:DUF5318 domain-containing protein [Corynebacterium sp.]
MWCGRTVPDDDGLPLVPISFAPAGSTLARVVNYRNEISHQWARRHVLRQFREGQVSRETICDADFLLVTAGHYHGEPAEYPCPVCGGDNLRIV